MNSECGVITFFSSQHAVHAEKVLKEHGFKIEMIPGPKEISPNCGVAIKYDYVLTESVKTLLESCNVSVEAFHSYKLPERKSLLDKIMGR